MRRARGGGAAHPSAVLPQADYFSAKTHGFPPLRVTTPSPRSGMGAPGADTTAARGVPFCEFGAFVVGGGPVSVPSVINDSGGVDNNVNNFCGEPDCGCSRAPAGRRETGRKGQGSEQPRSAGAVPPTNGADDRQRSQPTAQRSRSLDVCVRAIPTYHSCVSAMTGLLPEPRPGAAPPPPYFQSCRHPDCWASSIRASPLSAYFGCCTATGLSAYEPAADQQAGGKHGKNEGPAGTPDADWPHVAGRRRVCLRRPSRVCLHRPHRPLEAKARVRSV